MSINNIVINDGASTPVSHTFTPSYQSGLLTGWQEEDTDLAMGSNVLTASIKDPSVAGREVDQIRMKLKLPEVVLDTATGTYKVDYFSTVEVNAVVSRKSSAAHRKNLRVLMSNALLNATLAAYFDSRTPAM